jgi:hypothetical protein
MDPLKSELIRARQILDRMEGRSKGDLDTYRALDALWQVLYYMMLEAGGVVSATPAPEVQERVAKTLEKLMDKGDGPPANPPRASLRQHGQYL